jgi:hypothetical protein
MTTFIVFEYSLLFFLARLTKKPEGLPKQQKAASHVLIHLFRIYCTSCNLIFS